MPSLTKLVVPRRPQVRPRLSAFTGRTAPTRRSEVAGSYLGLRPKEELGNKNQTFQIMSVIDTWLKVLKKLEAFKKSVIKYKLKSIFNYFLQSLPVVFLLKHLCQIYLIILLY